MEHPGQHSGRSSSTPLLREGPCSIRRRGRVCRPDGGGGSSFHATRTERRGASRATCARRHVPVDCIATAGNRGRARPEVSRILSHQFFPVHFLRILRRGLPDLRDPAHARLRDGGMEAGQPRVRKGGSAHKRHRQIPGLQFLPRIGCGNQRGKERGRHRGRAAHGRKELAAMSRGGEVQSHVRGSPVH